MNFALFFIPFSLSLLFTPFSIKLAKTWHVMDTPSQVKIQKEPTPRMGGIAIFLGAFLTCLFYILNSYITAQLAAALAGSVIIFSIGLIDDLFDIKPLLKLSGQFLAALIPLTFGFIIDIPTLGWATVLLTLFIIIGSSNALNLIDGLDGLASGVSVLAASFFFYISFVHNATIAIALSLIVIGSALGFLKYNIHKAKTFMGDSGSLFLGYLLAILAIICINEHQNKLSSFIGVILILGLLIFDTSLSITRRYMQKKPLFNADLDHFYNQLMIKYHLSHKNTVIICWIFCFLFGILGIISYFANALISIVILFFTIGVCIICTFKLRFLKE
ncbi:MAG: MraY family glycosyltransferase [Thermodesulfobacteriota bacterium]|nr:MraY family glycosyltransferase [Thermodesulfobacteriota bacterium]